MPGSQCMSRLINEQQLTSRHMTNFVAATWSRWLTELATSGLLAADPGAGKDGGPGGGGPAGIICSGLIECIWSLRSAKEARNALSDPLVPFSWPEFRRRCRQLGIKPIRLAVPPRCFNSKLTTDK